MANASSPKPGALQSWQRANIVAAIGYLSELIGRSPSDVRARAVYEGLLDVLDPTRRAMREQRELSDAARTAAFTGERRRGERRKGERRRLNLGPPGGVERRSGLDRRSGRDRRRNRA